MDRGSEGGVGRATAPTPIFRNGTIMRAVARRQYGMMAGNGGRSSDSWVQPRKPLPALIWGIASQALIGLVWVGWFDRPWRRAEPYTTRRAATVDRCGTWLQRECCNHSITSYPVGPRSVPTFRMLAAKEATRDGTHLRKRLLVGHRAARSPSIPRPTAAGPQRRRDELTSL